jgi:hypothetical protein
MPEHTTKFYRKFPHTCTYAVNAVGQEICAGIAGYLARQNEPEIAVISGVLGAGFFINCLRFAYRAHREDMMMRRNVSRVNAEHSYKSKKLRSYPDLTPIFVTSAAFMNGISAGGEYLTWLAVPNEPVDLRLFVGCIATMPLMLMTSMVGLREHLRNMNQDTIRRITHESTVMK